MLRFVGCSVAYPASLYLFSHLFASQKHKHDSENARTAVARSLGTVFCTLCLLLVLQLSWSFSCSLRLILQAVSVSLPFLTFLFFEFPSAQLNWWTLRNLLLAPAVEELYYRILLAQLCPSPIWLWSSLAFATAHMHDLIATSRANRGWQQAFPQFCTTFIFGVLQDSIAGKMKVRASVPAWICQSITHGLANFVGFPLLPQDHAAHRLQSLILFRLYPLLLIALWVVF